jgi:hypothetical protein
MKSSGNLFIHNLVQVLSCTTLWIVFDGRADLRNRIKRKKKNKEKLFAVILYEWGFSPPRTWCSTGRCLVLCPSAAAAAPVPPAILNKILITRDAFRFLDWCWRISWFPWSLLMGDESNSGRGRVLISSVALLLADSTRVSSYKWYLLLLWSFCHKAQDIAQVIKSPHWSCFLERTY